MTNVAEKLIDDFNDVVKYETENWFNAAPLPVGVYYGASFFSDFLLEVAHEAITLPLSNTLKEVEKKKFK